MGRRGSGCDDLSVIALRDRRVVAGIRRLPPRPKQLVALEVQGSGGRPRLGGGTDRDALRVGVVDLGEEVPLLDVARLEARGVVDVGGLLHADDGLEHGGLKVWGLVAVLDEFDEVGGLAEDLPEPARVPRTLRCERRVSPWPPRGVMRTPPSPGRASGDRCSEAAIRARALRALICRLTPSSLSRRQRANATLGRSSCPSFP
jgi:hypothetical protein